MGDARAGYPLGMGLADTVADHPVVDVAFDRRSAAIFATWCAMHVGPLMRAFRGEDNQQADDGWVRRLYAATRDGDAAPPKS